jgi:hypothetical protein
MRKRLVRRQRTLGPAITMTRDATMEEEEGETLAEEGHRGVISNDDDEEEVEGEEVARFPSDSHHVLSRDGQHIVFRSSPKRDDDEELEQEKTDTNLLMDVADAKRTNDSRPPRTLAQLNEYMANHYRRPSRQRMVRR